MRTFIVTRHPGAIEWIRRQLATADATVLHHVERAEFQPGDRIYGVLPLSLAARICAVNAQAHVLTYDVPETLRGQELSAAMLDALGAKLIRYEVREWSSSACGQPTVPAGTHSPMLPADSPSEGACR